MEIDKSDEVLVEKAISLNSKNLFIEALSILLEIEAKYKKSSMINGLIATSYYHAKEYGMSAEYYKRTIELNPRSELASLGLFHSLWEMKNYSGAFKEMDRFLSSNEANTYKVTLKELFEQLRKRTPRYQRTIVEVYYKKYFRCQ